MDMKRHARSSGDPLARALIWVRGHSVVVARNQVQLEHANLHGFPYHLGTWVGISLALAIPFVLLALRINDVKKVSHGAYRGLRKALVSPRLIPVMGYVTVGLLVVVVPSAVWTPKLATTARVPIMVLLGVTKLLVAIGLLMKWAVAAGVRQHMAASDTNSSYLSDSMGGYGS